MARVRTMALSLLAASSLVSVAACREAASPLGDGAARPLPACDHIGGVLDLRAALNEGVLATGPVGDLAYVDQLYASLEAYAASADKAGFGPQIASARDSIAAYRTTLAERVSALAKTGAQLDAVLDKAVQCEGVDARFPESPAGAPGEARLRVRFHTAPALNASIRKKNDALLESKKCASVVRIRDAIRALSTDSPTSTKSVAEHLRELSFKGSSAESRDALVRALLEHAESLKAILDVQKARASQGNDFGLGKLKVDIAELASMCGAFTPPALIGNDAGKVHVVLVKPRWDAMDGGEPRDTGAFGSGVLFLWRKPDGSVEPRLLTNAHVMGGAREAEVLDVARLESQLARREAGKDPSPKWIARVVRDTGDEDLVVLKFTSSTTPQVSGLTLRPGPTRNEEPVTAAGFPGLGERASFQITKGSISNAAFRSGPGAFGAFIQHTAAIDPGSSGGPLYDAQGRLLGINTIKAMGRESVGLAIPTARVSLALRRADEKPRFSPRHAEALCNALADALSGGTVTGELVERIAIGESKPTTLDARMTTHLGRMPRDPDPFTERRRLALAEVQVSIDDDGGVAEGTTCLSVETKDSRFLASLKTRRGVVRFDIVEEDGKLRARYVK
jgi:S1-C subfamily serine protease